MKINSKFFINSVKWIYENVKPEEQHREYLKMYSDKGLRYSWATATDNKNEWVDNYTNKG